MKTLIALVCMLSLSAFAQDLKKTGEGIRQKKILFVNVNVYRITSLIKGEVTEKSRKGLLEANIDKQFELVFLRDVGAEKIVNSLKTSYETCGLKDEDKIKQMLGAFKGDFKEGDKFTISYTAADSKTVMTSSEGARLEFAGADFMKQTWCIWLDKGIKEEQPKLRDELVEFL